MPALHPLAVFADTDRATLAGIVGLSSLSAAIYCCCTGNADGQSGEQCDEAKLARRRRQRRLQQVRMHRRRLADRARETSASKPVEDLFNFFAITERRAGATASPLMTQASFERLELVSMRASSLAEARRNAKVTLRSRAQTRLGLNLYEFAALYGETGAAGAQRDWNACFGASAVPWTSPLDFSRQSDLNSADDTSHDALRRRLRACAARLARLAAATPLGASALRGRDTFAPSDLRLRCSSSGQEVEKLCDSSPGWANATISTAPMEQGMHYAEFLARPTPHPRSRQRLTATAEYHDIRAGLQQVDTFADGGVGCELPPDEVIGLLLDLESSDGELYLMRDGRKPVLLSTGLRGGAYLWSADLFNAGDQLCVSPLNANSMWMLCHTVNLPVPCFVCGQGGAQQALEARGGASASQAADYLYDQLIKRGSQHLLRCLEVLERTRQPKELSPQPGVSPRATVQRARSFGRVRHTCTSSEEDSESSTASEPTASDRGFDAVATSSAGISSSGRSSSDSSTSEISYELVVSEESSSDDDDSCDSPQQAGSNRSVLSEFRLSDSRLQPEQKLYLCDHGCGYKGLFAQVEVHEAVCTFQAADPKPEQNVEPHPRPRITSTHQGAQPASTVSSPATAAQEAIALTKELLEMYACLLHCIAAAV